MNPSVFEKLYRDSFKRLCQKAYRITLDRDAAEDIVQDAFIKLLAMDDKHVGIPEAYLYRSVINGSLNYIRRQKRAERIAEPHVTPSDRTPLSDLQANELQANIQRAISSMPPGCREVFLLSRYEEMSYQQIAEFLSISVNTVEKQVGKALQILREVISPTGGHQ